MHFYIPSLPIQKISDIQFVLNFAVPNFFGFTVPTKMYDYRYYRYLGIYRVV